MIQYVVIQTGETWSVYQNGERLEQHSYRLDAIEAAYLLALVLEEYGDRTELWVQDSGGELERWALQSWSGSSLAPTCGVDA
jgi:hypothetical protein